jgi:hypothetical protein
MENIEIMLCLEWKGESPPTVVVYQEVLMAAEASAEYFLQRNRTPNS